MIQPSNRHWVGPTNDVHGMLRSSWSRRPFPPDQPRRTWCLAKWTIFERQRPDDTNLSPDHRRLRCPRPARPTSRAVTWCKRMYTNADAPTGPMTWNSALIADPSPPAAACVFERCCTKDGSLEPRKPIGPPRETHRGSGTKGSREPPVVVTRCRPWHCLPVCVALCRLKFDVPSRNLAASAAVPLDGCCRGLRLRTPRRERAAAWHMMKLNRTQTVIPVVTSNADSAVPLTIPCPSDVWCRERHRPRRTEWESATAWWLRILLKKSDHLAASFLRGRRRGRWENC